MSYRETVQKGKITEFKKRLLQGALTQLKQPNVPIMYHKARLHYDFQSLNQGNEEMCSCYQTYYQ